MNYQKHIFPHVVKPESWSEDKWHEYQRIIKSFDVDDIPTQHEQWILTALHDEAAWDWYNDCNGANVVSEAGWPKSKGTGIAYHPAYIYHDYAWTKYGATLTSNNRMHLLQMDYRMSPVRSAVRWLGVTLFGLPCHYIRRWLF